MTKIDCATLMMLLSFHHLSMFRIGSGCSDHDALSVASSLEHLVVDDGVVLVDLQRFVGGVIDKVRIPAIDTNDLDAVAKERGCRRGNNGIRGWSGTARKQNRRPADTSLC